MVRVGRRALPAELAILKLELRPGENGVWMNSRGTSTGVVDLIRSGNRFQTQRSELPRLVTTILKTLYKRGEFSKGCPDLVIWRGQGRAGGCASLK